MGLLPCPLSYQSESSDSDSQSQSNRLHYSDSSSLSSQPSLPSVPSLTSTSQPPSAAHHHCAATLQGHSAYVFSLSLAGKNLYSGSSDSQIRTWPRSPSAPDNYVNNVVAAGSSAVKSTVVLGEKLFTAHQDHKIRVWKINKEAQTPNEKYQNVAVLPTITDRFTRLFAAKNYVKIRRHKKCTWVHHVDTVSALALSRDGSHLYSVSWDRSFKVWRTADFKCLESVWNAHDDAINAIALSNDGRVYTGSADKKIKVWKRKEGENKHTLVDTLEKHVSAVNSLALSTDGSVLYSGACDRSIIVWEKDGGGGGRELRHMVVVGALRGHTKAILCLAAVSDLVFSGSADKTVRIWRRGLDRNYSCLGVLEGHRGPVKCLAAGVDSSGSGHSNSSTGTSYKVYSGSLDCDIKIWQVWVPFL